MKQNEESMDISVLENVAEEMATTNNLLTEIKDGQVNTATVQDVEKIGMDIGASVDKKIEDLCGRIFEPWSLLAGMSNKVEESNMVMKEGFEDLNVEVSEKLVTVNSAVEASNNKIINYIKAAMDEIRRDVRRAISGHWWVVMPLWVKIVAIAGILGTIGFGWAYISEVEANAKFRKQEWLYRYERISYDNEGIHSMMLREEAMFVGTKEEQDSIKRLVIRMERAKHAERTHSYFRPTDDWTPEKKPFWQ